MGTKIRHKDYKRIQIMKSIDTSFYRERMPYLVKFNDDPKGKGIDYGDGAIGICIEASGGNLTFVFVKGTYVHEKYDTKCVSISCQYLDESKIEIVPFWSDYEVLDLIDHVKHNPDKYHGAAYYNEEIEILDQDRVEGEALFKDFYIKDLQTDEVYPLIIEDESAKNNDPLKVTKCFKFNMPALESIVKCNWNIRFSIKKKHSDKKYRTADNLKMTLFHSPDGFKLYRDDDDDEFVDCWFPGDILSYAKGMHIEIYPDGTDPDLYIKKEEENNE